MAKEKNEKPNEAKNEMQGNVAPIIKGVQGREISAEMRDSYIDYAMSVIVSRALPDARDGLKPVHRRILYAMYEDGLTHGAKFRKSATVVGSTLGRYHPHGDQSVYDAAMRYTEMRLSKVGEETLKDIGKNTVDFRENYDGTRKEPTLLPSPLPQLLLNGSLGIAVGMATNIPPHNLSELCDALIYLVDNPKSDTEDLF